MLFLGGCRKGRGQGNKCHLAHKCDQKTRASDDQSYCVAGAGGLMIAKSPSQNSWQCGPREEGQPQRTSANPFPCFLRIPHAATASKV